MIPGVGQLREARTHGPTGNLAVPGDDGCPITRWDLDRDPLTLEQQPQQKVLSSDAVVAERHGRTLG
jgi:hypothetical protein